MTGVAFVEALRGWIGTPYHHGQMLKQVGCDCSGLIVGCAVEVGLYPAEEIVAVQANTPRHVPVGYCEERLKRFCIEVDIERRMAGTILCFEMLGSIQHMAVCNGQGGIVHTQQIRGVVEVPAIPDKINCRLVKAYYPVNLAV